MVTYSKRYEMSLRLCAAYRQIDWFRGLPPCFPLGSTLHSQDEACGTSGAPDSFGSNQIEIEYLDDAFRSVEMTESGY